MKGFSSIKHDERHLKNSKVKQTVTTERLKKTYVCIQDIFILVAIRKQEHRHMKLVKLEKDVTVTDIGLLIWHIRRYKNKKNKFVENIAQ